MIATNDNAQAQTQRGVRMPAGAGVSKAEGIFAAILASSDISVCWLAGGSLFIALFHAPGGEKGSCMGDTPIPPAGRTLHPQCRASGGHPQTPGRENPAPPM